MTPISAPCLYIYIHIHTHTRIYKLIYIYTYICIFVCMYSHWLLHPHAGHAKSLKGNMQLVASSSQLHSERFVFFPHRFSAVCWAEAHLCFCLGSSGRCNSVLAVLGKVVYMPWWPSGTNRCLKQRLCWDVVQLSHWKLLIILYILPWDNFLPQSSPLSLLPL